MLELVPAKKKGSRAIDSRPDSWHISRSSQHSAVSTQPAGIRTLECLTEWGFIGATGNTRLRYSCFRGGNWQIANGRQKVHGNEQSPAHGTPHGTHGKPGQAPGRAGQVGKL